MSIFYSNIIPNCDNNIFMDQPKFRELLGPINITFGFQFQKFIYLYKMLNWLKL